MRTRINLAAALFLLGLSPAAGQEAAAPAEAAPPPAEMAAPAAAGPVIPDMTGPQIVIATSMGDITLQMDYVRAPISTDNVIRYVRARHYDGTVFYRVAKGFVIQMGSWDAKMKGRAGRPGPVKLEAGNGLSNVRGTVALGHGDAPDSAGADFFINVGDNSGLDRKPEDTDPARSFAVFAKVIAGMDVVDAINAVPVGDGGPMAGQWPLTPIVIKKVSIVPGSDAMMLPEKKAPAKKAPVKK